MWQAISAVIFYLLVFLIVVLLFLIWRESVTRSQKASQAFIDVALKSTETSNKSSEAALKAAEAASKGSEAALKAAEAVRILAMHLEKA